MKRSKPAANRQWQQAGHSQTCGMIGITADDCREVFRSRLLKKSVHSDRFVDRWVANQLMAPKLKSRTISLLEMQGWHIVPETGNICHESGRFFSIIGAHIRHRAEFGEIEWDQPLIDQPEVGILGILAKKISGVLHFCLQAKEEPGNINSVQLSPTLQATYSNYTRVHGGSPPKFIEYFLDRSKARVIYAKLQSEDGGRFLYKSNRNVIVQVAESELVSLPEGFIWLTLRQIVRLLQRDNLIHACTRSILSSLQMPASVDLSRSSGRNSKTGCASSLEEIIQWIDDRKAINHIMVKRTALNSLQEWSMDRDGSFSHEEGRFFRVIGIDVQSTERETSFWCQPILDNPGIGIIGLLTRVVNGERFFLMQAKAEPGNRGIVQIAPTVQFTPRNYISNPKLLKPFCFEEFCQQNRFTLLFDSMQSEEGARFYQESHLHRIMELPSGIELDIPPDFLWISLSDLHRLIHMGDIVNSCARSIIALICCDSHGNG